MSDPAPASGWRRLRDQLRSRLRPSSHPLDRLAAAACREAPERDAETLLDALSRASEGAKRGVLGPRRGAVLEEVAGSAGFRAFLQLGAGSGEAALRLARALGGDERLTLVEPSPRRRSRLQQLTDHAALSDRLDVLACSVLDAIPSLHRRFDLLLLAHDPAHFLADLRHAERHGRLGVGSLVVARLDDVSAVERDDYRAHVRGCGLYTSHSREGLEVSRCTQPIEAW